MTWVTESGERILSGIEAQFYLKIMQAAVERLEEADRIGADLDWQTGDRIFDNASFVVKIVLLHASLSALLNPDVPAPKLTNVTEAAAFFPFAFLEFAISEEIDLARDGEFEDDLEHLKHYYRQMTWDTFKILVLSESQDEEYLVDDYYSTDVDQWQYIIDGLAARIFYDRDWRETSFHPQLLDGIDKKFSQATGIHQDYIINRLPEATAKQAAEALSATYNWQLSS
jgi:hypothetical protein